MIAMYDGRDGLQGEKQNSGERVPRHFEGVSLPLDEVPRAKRGNSMQALVSRMLEEYEGGKINRRQLIQALAVVAVGPRAVAAPESTFQGVEINHVALRVNDVGRSRDFYQKHLGMPVVRQSSSDCFLGLGENFLALFKGSEARMDHYCIAIQDYDVKRVTEELRRQGMNPDQPSGSNRVYFPDPDGLTVQLSAVDHSA